MQANCIPSQYHVRSFRGKCRFGQCGQQRFTRRSCTTVPTAEAEAPEIVTKLLDAIKDTDSGASTSSPDRASIDNNLAVLEEIGNSQPVKPLNDPRIFGNYNVAYVSSANGQPAGGRFRSGLGRAIFRTRGLFQSILQPDLAVNKVEFNLLGFIPGYVGLRGQFAPYEGSQDTVVVNFEPPVLNFCNALTLCIGPSSKVVLKTTYLDDKIRLGKGKFGSLFVFTRGGPSDSAGMDQVGLEPKKVTIKSIAASLLQFGALAASLWLLASGTGVVQKACGAAGVVLTVLISLILTTKFRMSPA